MTKNNPEQINYVLEETLIHVKDLDVLVVTGLMSKKWLGNYFLDFGFA